jgi:hypothetical protein
MFAMDMQVEQFLEFRIHALGEKKIHAGRTEPSSFSLLSWGCWEFFAAVSQVT